jgi:hypothetical protein
MDDIIRLSGRTSSFRLRWRLAKQCALKDLRICGQEQEPFPEPLAAKQNVKYEG